MPCSNDSCLLVYLLNLFFYVVFDNVAFTSGLVAVSVFAAVLFVVFVFVSVFSSSTNFSDVSAGFVFAFV